MLNDGSDAAPTTSHYMSDTSHQNLAQQVRLAPKLNKSAAASVKPKPRSYATNIATGPRSSGKTANSQNRTMQNGFQVFYSNASSSQNRPVQMTVQQQEQSLISTDGNDPRKDLR